MVRCCICNHPIKGWGNNPWPVNKIEGARCCDFCNFKHVIPARLAEMESEDGSKSGKDV